jgi:hypothetical protein
MLLAALLVSVVSGQVAGVCGPGKRCEARDFVATKQGAANDVSFSLGKSRTNGLFLYSGNTPGISFAGAWQALFGWGGFSVYTSGNLFTTGSIWTTSVSSTNGYNASLAFGAFPACGGVTVGRLLYDSTNAVWRWCDGSSWKAIASEVDVPKPAQFAGVCFGVCSEDTYFTGAYQPASQEKVSKVTCSWRVPGTGGSTGVVVRVVDVDTPDVVCECTLGACNTAANQPLSCNCSGNIVDKRFTFRLSTATDCVTNPTDIVCNAG